MNRQLPLIDLLAVRGWTPEAMATQKDPDRLFARKTEQLKRSVAKPFEEMEKDYTQLLRDEYHYRPWSKDSLMSAEAVSLLSCNVPYEITKNVNDTPQLLLPYQLERSYANRFYEMAVIVDVIHCLKGLNLKNQLYVFDLGMKQEVRATLMSIAYYCRQIKSFPSQIYEMMRRQLTALYFEIVHTYVHAHPVWRTYLSDHYAEQLPLEWWEFTASYWPVMPTEQDEEAWERFEQLEPTPTVMPEGGGASADSVLSADETEHALIKNKYTHFVETVTPFQFFDMPKLRCLTKHQCGLLIWEITKHADRTGAYAVAMLVFLGYDTWMKEQYTKLGNMRQVEIIKHWCDALLLKNSRAVFANYRLVKNSDCKEDTEKYKSREYVLRVEEDYNRIKESQGV